MSGLIDPATTVLTQALSGLTTRQAVISSNLANIDTPNYQAQSVDFETALSQEVEAMYSPQGSALAPASGPSASMALLTSDPRHFSSIGTDGQGQATTTSTVNETLKNDGNTVDLDRTMVAMAENALQYGASAKAAGKKLAILRYVVSDGQG